MSMTKKIVLAGLWMLGCTAAFGSDNPPAAVDWTTVLPAVQSVVRHVFPMESANAHYPPSISVTADLTGNGGSVALVNLGSGGYTDDLTVMRLEGGAPVAARFRGKDDKITPMVFMSGLSDNKGTAVELMPKDHAVFSGHWTVSGVKLKNCKGEAYQWDATAKNFKLDKKLSKSMTKEFCPKVEAKLVSAVLAPAPATPAVASH
jgi:hypothetical protein